MPIACSEMGFSALPSSGLLGLSWQSGTIWRYPCAEEGCQTAGQGEQGHRGILTRLCHWQYLTKAT